MLGTRSGDLLAADAVNGGAELALDVRKCPEGAVRVVEPLLVDPRGFEPLTSWLPAKRSTS